MSKGEHGACLVRTTPSFRFGSHEARTQDLCIASTREDVSEHVYIYVEATFMTDERVRGTKVGMFGCSLCDFLTHHY